MNKCDYCKSRVSYGSGICKRCSGYKDTYVFVPQVERPKDITIPSDLVIALFTVLEIKAQKQLARLHRKEKKLLVGSITKEEAVSMLGGCCSICGYNKCLRALQFHHTRDKLYSPSKMFLDNMLRTTILSELEKCILVCANCHMELHHTT